MNQKAFPGQEILVFDLDRNCMVLDCNGHKIPCVNWYQHKPMEIFRRKLSGELDLKTIKGNLQASFVAVLLHGEINCDSVIIGHSFVHPHDRSKANKVHGRTIAARRLVKAWNSCYNDLYHMSYYLNATEGVEANFYVLDSHAVGKLDPIDSQLLPAVYRKLRRING